MGKTDSGADDGGAEGDVGFELAEGDNDGAWVDGENDGARDDGFGVEDGFRVYDANSAAKLSAGFEIIWMVDLLGKLAVSITVYSSQGS